MIFIYRLYHESRGRRCPAKYCEKARPNRIRRSRHRFFQIHGRRPRLRSIRSVPVSKATDTRVSERLGYRDPRSRVPKVYARNSWKQLETAGNNRTGRRTLVIHREKL
jgi:hypothetical protein